MKSRRGVSGVHEIGPLMWWRRALLAPAAIALVMAISGGLSRLGVSMPDAVVLTALDHGPLMVCGFLGTLICLERAIAARTRWATLLPLMSAVGVILILRGELALGRWSFLAASVGLTLLTASLALKRLTEFSFVMSLAASCWAVGNAAWARTGEVPAAVFWWMAFLVLTIAAERLELSRFAPTSRRARWCLFAILIAAVASVAWGELRAFGACLIALTWWLAVFDVARRTLRQRGLPRYAAVALLSGFSWLGIGGATLLLWAEGLAGATYDAALHAVFVGFVFAMIFAHAPILLPAIARVTIPFHSALYVPLWALHVSVALRLSGDVLGHAMLRRSGALGNAVAILGFVAVAVLLIVRSRRTPSPTPAPRRTSRSRDADDTPTPFAA
jgi:hypothetical protein